MSRRRVEPVAVGLLAAAAAALFFAAPTVPGYDSYYSLLWGRELIHGIAPSFTVYQAPTHHPLFLALSALLALAGTDADRLLVLVCVIAFVALVWATFRTGAAVFGPGAGLVAVLLVLASPTLLLYAARAYVDVPFVACVMWAAAVEARTPRARPGLVMVLLLVAGLLRPEAWLLACAYWLWIGWRRIDLLAMVLAGPLCWGIVDAAATGDPLHSLHATSGQADELHRVRGLGAVPHALVSSLDSTVRAPVVVAGALAAVVCAVRWLRAGTPSGAVHVPLALLAGGILTFAATGVAGLSLLPRYLTVPAVALCLLAGPVAVELVRRLTAVIGARGGAAAVVLVVALGAVYVIRGGPAGRAVAELRFVHASHERLQAIVHAPAVAAARRCGPLTLPNYRLVPDTRWVLHATARQVGARSDHLFARGVALVVHGRKAVARFGRAAGASAADNRAPPGFRAIASNRTFTAYAGCAAPTP